jgi:Undecaprenyl-phosphate galactose phosphotransferase WbaP
MAFMNKVVSNTRDTWKPRNVAVEVNAEGRCEVPPPLSYRVAITAKRGMDVLAGSLLLCVASPLFPLIAIAVRMGSPGPVLYRHSRIGRGGRSFNAFKFRTMVVDAEEVLKQHLAEHPDVALEWLSDHKLKEDPRVTSLGKWLRKVSLDELPQIINVLTGEMSLVGPRPIVNAEVEKYGPTYSVYTTVRPGITGLWQVSGRNDTTYQERVTLDNYYVMNWSIWLDMRILIRTAKVLLTTEGAY